MSTTIDQRVVEMRFDNKNFESNVQTSMSTLEKLKQRLNLTGATKGLENVGSAARKVNLSNLGGAAETVGLKFNAMYSMADQALRNITTRVQHTAENLVKSFTIDPVKTGLSEYETQINAVQTILANTQHNGTTLDEVNTALDTLNTYADKTIYNFTEMTRNIGTFTAAGVDLQTSVESIQGIANLAAVSGSTSQQASTAMYQLSQALAAGKVSLMDWNSVVNAGMGGKVFQDSLLRTSELLKTGGKEAVNTYGSFRESLTKGEWLTTEVLTETLKQLSGAYSEADLIAQGFTKEQAKEISELAETATNAATKVKTFTQLMDTLKEATQSGWTQTWEILIGDFEEAKKLWTGISDTLGEIINKSSERRNKVLGGAMDSGWDKMIGKIEEAGIEAETFDEKLRLALKGKGYNADKLVKEYGSLEEAFQQGAFKADVLKIALNGLASSVTDLSNVRAGLKMGDTGEDVKKVQEALKGLGYNFDKFGIDGIIGDETTNAIKAFQELKGLEVTGVVDEKTLQALEEAGSLSSKLKGNIDGLIDGVDKLGGRQLLIESFANIWKGILSVVKPIKSAFASIFPPITSEQIYKLIEGFHSLTEKFKLNHEQAKKLRKTFKGIFAVIDIIATITGGALKFGFEAITGLLAGFDLDILDVTSAIADAIIKFRNWVKSTFDIKSAFEAMAPYVKLVAGYIKDFFLFVWNMPNVQTAISDLVSTFSGLFSSIKSFFTGGFEGTPEDIINGLVNGLKAGGAAVWNAIVELATGLITHFCEVLGIHSPSTVMEEKGENIGEGLLNGLKTIATKIWDFVKGIGTKIADIFGKIDWRTLFAAGMGIAMVMTVKNMIGILENVTSPLDGIGDLLEGFTDVTKAFTKKLNAQALKHIAEAIAILVGSVIALSFVAKDPKALWNAVGAVFVLAAVIGGLLFAMNKMSDASVKFEKGKFNMDGLKTGLISLGATLLLMAVAVKLIGSMSLPQAIGGFVGLAALVGMIAITFAVFGKMVTGGSAANIDKAGIMLVKMSVSLALLAIVCRLVAKLSPGDLAKGMIFMVAFVGFAALLTKATKIGKKQQIAKLGGLLIAMSVSLALMVGVCKLVGLLSVGEAVKGALFMGAFLLFIKVLVKVVQIGEGQQMAKLGGMLLSISLSLILMVGVCKLIGLLTPEEVLGGIIFVGAFLIFIKVLVKITQIGNDKEMAKVAGTILALSLAIMLLAGVTILLGLLKLEDLAKGVAAVTVLGLIMSGMIIATKKARKIQGAVVAMAVAIAVMAVAVAGLSMIDGKKLAGAVSALSILMGMFALMELAAGKMGKVIGSLITMTVAVGVLTGILFAISGLPVEGSLGNAAALSILMLAMSTSMAIISKTGTMTKVALPAMLSMVAITGIAAVVLGILSKLDVQPSIETATALSILLLAMSGACLILSYISPAAGLAAQGALQLAGVVGLIAGVITAVSYLMGLLPDSEMAKIEKGLDNITLIVDKIGFAIGSFVSNLAEGLTSSLPQIGTNIGNFFTNMLSAFESLPEMNASSFDWIGALAGAILQITAAEILNAATAWLTGGSSLSEFATQLKPFGEGIKAYSDAVGTITDDDITKITKTIEAAKSIIEASKDVPNEGGLLSTIIGDNTLTGFSEGLKPLGQGIKDYSAAVGEITDDDITKVTKTIEAAKSIIEASKDIQNEGGMLTAITGDNTLTGFSEGLKPLGQGIRDYSDSITSLTDEDITKVTKTIEAAKTIIGAAKDIENEGGCLTAITGDNTLTGFSEGLKPLGQGIMDYSTAVGELTDDDISKVTKTISAAKSIIDASQGIENIGGAFAKLFGDNDLGTFGTSLTSFGKSLATFSSETGTIDTDKLASISSAITTLVEIQGKINGQDNGGWLSESEITKFGSNLESFGASIQTYSNKVSEIKFAAISASISTVRSFVNMLSTLTDIDTTGIEEFKKVDGIATAIADYDWEVADINTSTINSSISIATRLKSFITSLSGIDASGVDSFASSVTKLGQTDLSGFAKTFSSVDLSSVGSSLMGSLTSGIKNSGASLSNTASTMIGTITNTIGAKGGSFSTAGGNLMANLVKGIQSKASVVKVAVSATVSGAAGAISGHYGSFYANGGYLGTGLVNGINAKKSAVYWAGYELGKRAAQGVKDGEDAHSPSKEGIKAGNWLGEGLVIGINDMGTKVYRAGHSMGESAVKSLSAAMSRASELVNDSMFDNQPTIRPVLDLSDVKAGAGNIGNLLGMGQTIGVSANIGAVSSMMNGRIQNGGNGDVVSAINKLSKQLSNVGGSTYNVNGVTYDDGTNVSNAVQSLIRAAKIEGRA